MRVVIVGDLEMDSPVYKRRVLALMSSLKAKYSDLMIVSAGCERGIGYFVRERCISDKEKRDIAFVDFSVNIWAVRAKPIIAMVYMAKNPALLELGEEFHIFSMGKKTGHIADLIYRVKEAKHKPTVFIYGEFEEDVVKIEEEPQPVISSGDLKSALEE